MKDIKLQDIELEVQKSDFVLNIPESVERKIRYHINRFPHTEWSGYMYYDYTGSFEEKNLVFTARDFMVLDVGTAGATTFTESARIPNFMFRHDLLDCKQALIH